MTIYPHLVSDKFEHRTHLAQFDNNRLIEIVDVSGEREVSGDHYKD